MITLKIKYTTTEDGLNLIKEYRKQYSSGVYNFLKKSKSRYRLSLDDLSHLEFSRCFSNRSKIKKILITHKNL